MTTNNNEIAPYIDKGLAGNSAKKEPKRLAVAPMMEWTSMTL